MPHKIRITHFWVASEHTCAYGVPPSFGVRGLGALTTEARKRKLQGLLSGTASGGRRPDVIVFNAGLHDIESADISNGSAALVAEYQTHLQWFFNWAQKETAAKSHLIWKTSGPLKLDASHGSCLNGLVHVFNTVGTKIAREYAADILDQSAFRYLAHPEAGDGLHCMPHGNGPKASWHYTSCHASLDMLLQLISLRTSLPLSTPRNQTTPQ
jgi:hypothetical protein